MLTKQKLKSEFAKGWKKHYENPFFLSQKESVASQRKMGSDSCGTQLKEC